MKQLLLIFIVSLAGGVGPGNNAPDFVMRNGMYYHAATGEPYNGTFDYTSEGSRYRGTIASGKREGVFAEWYPGGRKKFEIPYRNNRPDGRAVTWFENGEVRSDITFANNRLVRGVTYSSDGREASRITDGTGTLTAYFNNGRPSWEKTYQDGVRVRQRIFHDDGTLKSEN